MVTSMVELLRVVTQNQRELKVEIAELRSKVSHSDKKLASARIGGIDGILSIIDLKIPFQTKEEFDVLEEKLSDKKFFVKMVRNTLT